MNQSEHFTRSQFFWALVIFTPIVIALGRSLSFHRSMKIAEVIDYSIDEKRDIYSTFDTEDQNDQGLPIDPFDLMNRLKKAGAMNNATIPSDALDEALNAFDESGYLNVPFK